MAKNRDASFNDKTPTLDDPNSNKSFVKKIKSRVSGFLPSSLTRLFGSTESQLRYREESEDEDEESFLIQPPTKRIKPNDTITSVSFQLHSASTPIHSAIDVSPNKTHLNNVNHVENKLTFPEPIPGPSGYKPSKNLSSSGKSSLNKQYTSQNHVTNGDKYSDSGESVTSGYSSMLISGKDVVSDNKTEIGNDSMKYGISSRLNDRSLFSDCCVSPKSPNPSMSSRQPSFNSSVFGSPNFVDRTLASKKILNSPFYSGRTTYGGASAYGRSLASLSSDYKSTARNSVQIKPVNDIKYTSKNNTTLSKTARRILDTLEQYTTPISDAKKIPNPTNPNRKRSANPYFVRERVASNRELQVPTVPDLLKMKLKERLQDSTESVRQLANSSKSVLNREEYKIRTLEDDANASTKHTNKIKNKICSIRQKKEPHRTVEKVKLPGIQLPITTLPNFDFSLPPIEPVTKNTSTTLKANTTETAKTSTMTSSVKTVEKTSATQKTIQIDKSEVTTLETSKKSNNNVESNTTESKKSERSILTEFKFSDPVVIAENSKSVCAINNFIFSDPTPTNKTSNTPQISKELVTNDLTKSKAVTAATTTTTTPTLKNNGENRPLGSTNTFPNNTLKMFKADSNDLLAKFKSSNDTWECNVCLIRNVNTKNKCAACEASKPQETGKKQSSTGFGDKFKKADGQWDCKACLVINPADKNKCVACETPKQDVNVDTSNSKNENRVGLLSSDMWECKTCFVRNKNSDQKCIACTNPKPTANGPLIKLDSKSPQGFGLKFAPPPDTWECATCSIRNKNEVPKCLACESSRPAHIKPATSSGFGDNFKKKADQWVCDTCMVKNPKHKERCQCCDALRIGPPDPDIPKTTKPISLFNYGLDPSQKLTVTGFTFGIKQPEVTSSAPSTTASFISIFGQAAMTTNTSSVVTASTTTTPTFTFGIKQTQEKSESAIPVINIEESSSNSSNNLKAIGGKANDKVKIISNQVLKPAENSSTNESKKDENSTMNGETKIASGIFGTSSNKPMEPTSSASSNIFVKEAISSSAFPFGANPATAIPASTTSSPIFRVTPPQTTAPIFKFAPNEPSLLVPKPTAFGNATPQQNPTPSATFNAPSATPDLFNNPSQGAGNAFAAPPAVEPAPAVPAFGNDNTVRDEQPPAKMFSFGQGNKPETEQLKFGFGAVQPSTAPAPRGFSFGQGSAQPNLTFGANTNAAPAQTGLGFDQSAGNQNGAPIFNFGAGANATPKTGFNFGAAVAPQQAAPNAAAPNPGLFNFGGFQTNGPPPPNTGGFNFSSSVGSDFKPNFNFTGGAAPATFSAQPNPGEKSSRVMRKAVRRAHR
ncbi:hypothetical protein AMK59_1785 [Oryctes borbonicus]|uniref:Nuclear pore complex protein Nup153 n=1 Tax=Oryctes borbonicus TaxID=1629725 RepID=A0A0T6BD42_9SCAR|nr:hypothetical protein AMK59_1785 [Oryctes borbonicus]